MSTQQHKQCPYCGAPAEVRGLCRMHYMRERRHGDPAIVLRAGPKPRVNPEYPELRAWRLVRDLGLGLDRHEVETPFRQPDGSVDWQALTEALERTRDVASAAAKAAARRYFRSIYLGDVET